MASAAGPDLNAGVLSHHEFLNRIWSLSARANCEQFVIDFKSLLQATAADCVVDNATWVIPSQAYASFFFPRDSFWVLAALNNRSLSQLAVELFEADQAKNPDGHIATALYKDGSHPINRDRDEESTMMYVLHCYLLSRLGGSPNRHCLERARDFIFAHVVDGRYVTTGETRSGPAFGGRTQIGTYHYWADTFRPAGKDEATAEVIAYNQGLLCISLKCLDEMGIPVRSHDYGQALSAYANMVNWVDGVSLPQREGSTIVDVSSLVGDALSLYFFDQPLLSNDCVQSTLNRLCQVRYADGNFLGFKVISDYYGGYRPACEFSGTPIDAPGNYHNGGSWLLYDALALYCGVRHQVSGTGELFLRRLTSEVRLSWASHEFVRTDAEDAGGSDSGRDGYGWNAFVGNLLS
jgi:hypothetical protein